VAIVVVTAVLGAGALWRTGGQREEPIGSAAAAVARDSAEVSETRPLDTPAPLEGRSPRVAPGASQPPPSSGLAPSAQPRRPARPMDVAAWNEVKPAFSLRELGRMAPYVKTGLDAARTDMEFCFRARATVAEPPPAPADPAVLILYLEAREGAIDVVETTVEHRGAFPAEQVDCCREVLRGLEIPVFNAVPGQRYRFTYALD
jgi:hypothetical protein